MASSVANYEQMECAICNEEFRNPKVLLCSHTFCDICINEWILKCKTKSLSGIECPLCRKITPPPKTDSDPKVWSSMLPDFVNEEESKTILCQPCRFANETKKAKFYCVECNEYLCVYCQISHAKLSVSKFHKTIAVEKTGDGNMSAFVEYSKLLMCESHPEKAIEFFCEDDDDIFCSTCAFLDHRSCDEVLEIKSNYAGIERVKPLAAVSKWLQMLKIHVEENVAIRKRYDANLEGNDEKMTVMLKEVKSKVIKGFEKAHGHIRNEMKERNRDNKQSNEEGLNECERILQSIDTTDRTTKAIMDMMIGGPEYVVISRKLEEKHDELKEQVGKLNQSQETFSSHTFEFDSSFLQSLCQSETFGSFKEEKCDYSFPKLTASTVMKDRQFTLKKTDVSVSKARRQSYFTAACYILDDKDGKLVLADDTKKRLVILLHASGQERNEIKLSSKPYMIENTKKYVYASFPSEKKIRRYDIKAGFKQTTEVCTRMPCYAIQSASKCDDARVVASLNDEDNWELVTYDSDGREVESIDRDSDGGKLKSFWHFKIFDNTFYQSCQEDNTVNAFKLEDGEYTHVFTYTNNKLNYPGGIDVDYEKNIYICGISSANIHVITQEGQQIKILKLAEVEVPTSIAFSDNTEDVVVLGNANSPGPFFYRLM